MPDVVARVLKELKTRQAELQPLVDEHREVESALNALEPTSGGSGRSRGRANGSKRQTTGARRGRPRKGQPTRSDQFLALVREQPGISISQAAERMGVQPTSLYRVASKLEREGAIAKNGARGFEPRSNSEPEEDV